MILWLLQPGVEVALMPLFFVFQIWWIYAANMFQNIDNWQDYSMCLLLNFEHIFSAFSCVFCIPNLNQEVILLQ